MTEFTNAAKAGGKRLTIFGVIAIIPAVTFAFRLMGKFDLQTTLGYIGAPLIGAVLGSLPIVFWGARGKAWPLERSCPKLW